MNISKQDLNQIKRRFETTTDVSHQVLAKQILKKVGRSDSIDPNSNLVPMSLLVITEATCFSPFPSIIITSTLSSIYCPHSLKVLFRSHFLCRTSLPVEILKAISIIHLSFFCQYLKAAADSEIFLSRGKKYMTNIIKVTRNSFRV